MMNSPLIKQKQSQRLTMKIQSYLRLIPFLNDLFENLKFKLN